MTRECQVRICERLGVKFPGPTRPKEPSSECLPMSVDGVQRTEVVNGRVKEHGRLLRGSSATTVRSFPGRGPANTHRKSLARRAGGMVGLSRRCRDGLRLGVWWLREPQ
jgi:hypothetical protein